MVLFSFVVQDTNYKEMYDFYKLIESYFVDKDVTWEVKFTQIINWKTFTDKEYKIENGSRYTTQGTSKLFERIRKD